MCFFFILQYIGGGTVLASLDDTPGDRYQCLGWCFLVFLPRVSFLVPRRIAFFLPRVGKKEDMMVFFYFCNFTLNYSVMTSTNFFKNTEVYKFVYNPITKLFNSNKRKQLWFTEGEILQQSRKDNDNENHVTFLIKFKCNLTIAQNIKVVKTKNVWEKENEDSIGEEFPLQ